MRNMKQRRFLVDTSLRDGAQMPGLNMGQDQKLELAALLDTHGIHQIEAGIPAASPEERDTIRKILEMRTHALVSVWARLLPADLMCAIECQADLVHISVPVSPLQIEAKLGHDQAWVLGQLYTCLELASQHGASLTLGFEDAFRANMSFMTSLAQLAVDAGVRRIRLSDTVGIATPSWCRMLVETLSSSVEGTLELGIHAHNDLGLALANTLEALKAGCLYADVTIAGIGERAGNCPLADLIGITKPIFNWGLTAAKAHKLEDLCLESLKGLPGVGEDDAP